MLVVPNILTPDELSEIRAFLAAAPFVDGKVSATGSAQKAKANRQADAEQPGVAAWVRRVTDALERSARFQLYVRPVRYCGMIFNAYGPGETYGLHIDSPMMGKGEVKVRTDFSFTLFLSDPADYEGGELAIITPEGERRFKLPAGHLVVYGTGALHRVMPVLSGERLAAVGWAQSLIRNSDEREMLFDLGRLRSGMEEGDSRLLLDKVIANLIRFWGEP